MGRHHESRKCHRSHERHDKHDKCHDKCHKDKDKDCRNRIPCKHGDENWLQFGKTLSNTRNANCEKEINRRNATQLVEKWAFLTDVEFPNLLPDRYEFTGFSVEGNYGYAAALTDFGGGFGLAVKLDLTDGSPVWEAGTGLGLANPVPEFDGGIRFQPAIGKDLVYYPLRGFDFDVGGQPKMVALHKDTGLLAWETHFNPGPDPVKCYNYKFQTGFTVPLDGFFQLNNVDLSLVTKMRINCTDQDIGDICPFVDTVVPGGIVSISKGVDAVSYDITGGVQVGQFYELDLTYRDGDDSLVLQQGDDLVVCFAPEFVGNQPTSPVIYVEEDNIVIQGLVAIGSTSGSVQAFDGTTGAKLWEFKTTEPPEGTGVSIFGPGAVDTARNLVFYGTGQNFTGPASALQDSVFALNYLTGDFVWKRQFNTTDITSVPPIKNWDASGGPHLHTLCVNGKKRDVVLGGTKEGKFYVLDRISGDLINNYTITPPAPAGTENQGFNYSGCTDGKYYYFSIMYSTNGTPVGLGTPFNPATRFDINTAVLKINPENGQVLWRKEYVGSSIAPPAFANGVIYFNLLQGAKFPDPETPVNPSGTSFYAIDACTGETLKRVFRGSLFEGDFVASASTVTISNGVVYHTTTDGIYALELSGQGYSCSKSKSAPKSVSKSVSRSVETVDPLEFVKAYDSQRTPTKETPLTKEMPPALNKRYIGSDSPRNLEPGPGTPTRNNITQKGKTSKQITSTQITMVRAPPSPFSAVKTQKIYADFVNRAESQMNVGFDEFAWSPADPNMGVGLNRLIGCSNTAITIRDKASGVLISREDQSQFHTGDIWPSDHRSGDPIVNYDVLSERFFVTTWEFGNHAGFFPGQVTITSPGSISGNYIATIGSGSGSNGNFDLQGYTLELADPPGAETTLVNSLNGKIALVSSNGFLVGSSTKGNNCAAAGAVGMIIYNTDPGEFGDYPISIFGSDLIPSVSVGYTDGLTITGELPGVVGGIERIQLVDYPGDNIYGTMHIAVSKTSSPNDSNDFYHFTVGGPSLGAVYEDFIADFPKYGIDQDAIYISTLSFGPFPQDQNGFVGYRNQLIAFEKQPLVDGTGPVNILMNDYVDSSTIPWYGSASRNISAQIRIPSMYRSSSLLSEQAMFTVAAILDHPEAFGLGRSGSSFKIEVVRDVLGTPTIEQFTVDVDPWDAPTRENSDVNTSISQPPINVGTANCRDETTFKLDGNVAIVEYKCVIQNGSLWFCHCVGTAEPFEARWYELDITNALSLTPSITLVQQGSIVPGNGTSAFYPSISVNDNGDMGIGFSVSGPNQPVAIGYTGRKAGDSLGFTYPIQIVLANSTNFPYYDFTMNRENISRWDDYTSTTVDPSDGLTFWHFNQYAKYKNGQEWRNTNNFGAPGWKCAAVAFTIE